MGRENQIQGADKMKYKLGITCDEKEALVVFWSIA